MTDKQLLLVLLLWFIGSAAYYEWNTLASDYAASIVTLSSHPNIGDLSASTPTAISGFVFTMSTAQLSVGVIFALLMWLLRFRPTPQIGKLLSLAPLQSLPHPPSNVSYVICIICDDI